jgi:hypothetical protein
MTRHTAALTLALLVLALWLLWATRQDGGAHGVLLTDGLWWGAALQATWRVWVPAAAVLAGLYAAVPPRAPRRPSLRLVRAAAPRVPAIAPAPAAIADREPTHDPTQETSQAVTPGSTPAPVRTVWEVFAPLHQEGNDGIAS